MNRTRQKGAFATSAGVPRVELAEPVLLFGASRQHFGRDRLRLAELLQPISRREGSNHQMVPAFLDANKKEIEMHDAVNESQLTIKCLLIKICWFTNRQKAGND